MHRPAEPPLSHKEEVVRLGEQVRKLSEQLSRVSDENDHLKPQTREKEGESLAMALPVEPAPSQEEEEEMVHLMEEVCLLSEELSRALDENDHLKQQNREREEEISRLKRKLQAAQGKSGTWFPWWRGTSPRVKDFPIEFRTSGKTGGCEQKFLAEVSERLSQHSISLKVKEFTETSSKDLLLLVFCPIASVMGTDIQNALQGLHGKWKVLLVVMHYVRKDNPETSIDRNRQAPHPSVVQSVHTRYTLQDGFYPCEMNARAVADVADAIKELAGDP